MQPNKTAMLRLFQTPDRDLNLADYIDKCNAVADAQRYFRRQHGPHAALPSHLRKSTDPSDAKAQKQFEKQYMEEVMRVADIRKIPASLATPVCN